MVVITAGEKRLGGSGIPGAGPAAPLRARVATSEVILKSNKLPVSSEKQGVAVRGKWRNGSIRTAAGRSTGIETRSSPPMPAIAVELASSSSAAGLGTPCVDFVDREACLGLPYLGLSHELTEACQAAAELALRPG